MSCCLPDNVNCEDKIPSKVNFERNFQNRIAGCVFVAAILIQYILSIVTLTSVDDPTTCTGGVIDIADADFSTSFGVAMTEHVGAFIMAVILALLLGFLWIYSLQRCSKAVVWGTLAIEMVLAVAIAIASFAVPGLVGVGITILVFVGLAIAIVYVKKKAVDNAAIMLQSAAYCVQYNCSVVMVALGLLLITIAYSILPIAGMATSFVAGNWIPLDPTCTPSPTRFCSCVLSQPGWISSARVYNNFVLVWVFFFSNMARTYVVGTTAALWYWHPESVARPFTGLKWAFSKAFGTLSLGGLVVAILDRINRWASSKCTACCCMCNPVFLIICIVSIIYKEIVNSLAKFCIIVAAITGEDFYVCVGRSYYTLKGKFATLFVVDGVAKLVMYSASSVFSCVLWAFAWFVAAGISNEDTIGKQAAIWENGDLVEQILMVVLWILSGSLVYYPLIGIVVCVLWGSVIYAHYFGTSFLIGVFAGALSNYLFTFFADVVLDVTTVMFTIVRIDHQNGIKIKGELSVGSPAAVGMYYYKLSGDDTGTELVPPATTATATMAPPGANLQVQVVVAQPMYQQPMMAQPLMGQQMMAQPYGTQPYGTQPYGTQPYGTQPYGAQPMYGQPQMGPMYDHNGQPIYGQPQMASPMYQNNGQPMYQTMQSPTYGGQQLPPSDPYDTSKSA